MKVGFDISQTAHIGGVGRYSNELAHRLVGRAGLEMKFLYSSLRKPYRGDLPGVKSLRLPPTLFEPLANRTRLFKIEKLLGVLDVYHSSDWVQLPSSAKKVTTYHDLIPLKFPDWSTKRVVGVHLRRLKLVEKEIDKVIAVSQTTKQDLVELSTIPADKIEVIYEGVGEQYQRLPEDRVEQFLAKLKLPKKFVLAIGGVGNRRNLERIKEAARDYELVVSGQSIPWLSDEEMPYLYNAATVLLYPSLYEGFGLPILEAMACGVPVITSDLGAMREISGEAARLVDPQSVEGIKASLVEVVNDLGLRRELISKGLKQAQKFSWEAAADRTVEIYRQIAKP